MSFFKISVASANGIDLQDHFPRNFPLMPLPADPNLLGVIGQRDGDDFVETNGLNDSVPDGYQRPSDY